MKRDLLHHGIQLEEFGGEVQAVEISGLKVCALLVRFDPRAPVISTSGS